MKKYLFCSLLTLLLFSATSWVYGQTINVCLSVTDDTLALIYKPTTGYTPGQSNLWNNQLVTIRYPSSTTVSFGVPQSVDPDNFPWRQDPMTPGPGVDGGDNFRYVKFIMNQNATPFDFTANVPVTVFRLKVRASAPITFEVDNSSNWVNTNNGQLAINSSTRGNLAGIVTSNCGSNTYIPPCALNVTATPGSCAPATNQYSVSGTVSLTSATPGTLTITDGTRSTTLAVTALTTAASYTLTGLPSGSGSHTLTASLNGCGSDNVTYTAPASCSLAPPILGLAVTTPVCNSVTNAYVTTATISLTNAVASTLTITDNGIPTASLSITAGQTTAAVSVSGISNATSHTLVATLTGGLSASATYTAPASCSLAPCALNVTATPGSCAPATNQYSVSGTVSLTSATPGTLTITDGTRSTTLSISTGQTAASYTLTGLPAGSGSHTLTASLNGCGSDNVTYTAPASCSLAPCALNVTATPGSCAPATNQYSVSGTVSLTSATAGTLTITDGTRSTTLSISTGQTAASYTLTGLPSDGHTHTVTVMSDAFDCGMTSLTYTAPASCSLTLQAALGNYIWLDSNKNGVQDGTETGVPNVTVALCEATAGTLIATTATDESGKYLFSGLNSGTYVVKFTALTGTTFTTPSSSLANSATDSDAASITAQQGATRPVSLSAGETNLTIDAGLIVAEPMLTLEKLVDRSRAQINDVLTYKLIIRNTGTGAANDVVVLDSLDSGVQYMAGSVQASSGSFAPTGFGGRWTIPVVTAGSSATLTLSARVVTSGVLYNVASIPGDTKRVCTTIPMELCAGEQIMATAPGGRTDLKWYRNGVLVGSGAQLVITEPGMYTVQTAAGTCPNNQCCPLEVIASPNCCPVKICVPFVVKQTKRIKRIGDPR